MAGTTTGKGRKPVLTTQNWEDAALAAIGEGGLAAVAVEPLAVRLGATKGSFYWHFANRDALIEAALRRWERANTDSVMTATERAGGADAEQRLRNLFTAVPAANGGDPVEVALLATAKHPLVAPVLKRVSERRLAYVTQIFTDAGFTPAEARRRGLLIYTSHLGQTQLMHAVPSVLPATRQERKKYMDTLMFTLLRPGPS